MRKMDPEKITKLAELLKSEGDKVLTNEYKLTLSGSLLRALNDSFVLIVDTVDENPFGFTVVDPNLAKSDVFRDLQFIYDFVQKTITLCITGRFQPDEEKYEGHIDISKFTNVKTLEVQHVPVKTVVGLQQFRAHLKQLLCVRSLSECIREVIYECGGDNSASPFIWNNLIVVDFSYNALTNIDNSLEYAPYLETLNLSHNQLIDVTALRCLQNIKFLNLSYNRLIKIPIFHPDACKKLQTLIMESNFVEDVTDISCLDAIVVLDLRSNCLLEHSVLLPLTTLIALQDLNVSENPLACHPKHRQATARYLHRNTSTVKFILDGTPFTNYEKTLTGVYENYRPLLKSKPSESSMIRAATNKWGSTASFRNSFVEDTPIGSVISTSSVGLVTKFNASQNDLTASIISQQRKVRIREAKIDEQPATSVGKEARKSLEQNKEHLEFKKQVETLREQYGNQWLQNQSGDLLKSVVGFESTGHADKNKEFIDNLLHEEMTSSTLSTDTVNNFKFTDIETSTPNESVSQAKDESTVKDQTMYCSMAEEHEIESDYKSTLGSVLDKTDTEDNYKSVKPELQLSDPEDDEATYICINKETGEHVFLIVTENFIKERDTITIETITKWSIKSLESCERQKKDLIVLTFDTIKKMKKTRIYELDKEECGRLEQSLRKILEDRPLYEMNMKLYRCAVCNAQFSREFKSNKKDLSDAICPECKSSYVIEITEQPQRYPPDLLITRSKSTKSKEDPTPIQQQQQSNGENIPKSASHSSIAPSVDNAWTHKNKTRSSSSKQDSSSCSKLSKSESSFDSNQSVAGSGLSERDIDGSDIEVLSNPSQSSIEVLESLQSSRKHSEERRNINFSELDVLSGVNLENKIYNSNFPLTKESRETSTHDLKSSMMREISVKSEATTQTLNSTTKNMLLTESSSSGSVTDSICTAYEQNQEDLTIPSSNSEKAADSITLGKSESIPGIGSMLTDFLRISLLKGSKDKNSSQSEPNAYFEPYKYSYTDFNNADHRIHLFLFQHVFEDDGEKLKWLVKGRFYDENTTDTVIPGFSGIFVMSTTKFYILKAIKEECDDPSIWLTRFMSGTMDRVITIRVLPFKIGVTFTIKGIGNIHLLLYDILRTDSLLLYFAENALPDTCSIEYRISEDLLQKLASVSENLKISILSILNLCIIESNEQKNELQNCALIVTKKILYITTSNFKWLCASETSISISRIQPIADLVDVENLSPNTLQLNFVDDNQDNQMEEAWQLAFDTITSCDSAFETISHYWEKIYSVPLIRNNFTKIGNNE